MREKIIERTYKVLTKNRDVSAEDPDYLYVSQLLKGIPDSKLNNFYYYLIESKEYFNNRFLMPYDLKRAVTDYVEKLSKVIWEDHKIESKTAELSKKIVGIYGTTRKLDAQQLIDFYAKIDLAKINFVIDGKRDRLLSNEEIEIINHNGLVSLLMRYRLDGIVALKEDIEMSYKNYYTKEALFEKNKKTKVFVLLDDLVSSSKA